MFSDDFIKQLKSAWPFKRIRASKEMLNRYNAQFDENIVEFAITVNDDVKVTDELLWNAMISRNKWAKNATPLRFGEETLRSIPPHTGMSKKSIIE